MTDRMMAGLGEEVRVNLADAVKMQRAEDAKRENAKVPSREEFASGAVRDTNHGKTRIDLIDPVLLDRVGHHLSEGAKHYGEHNWQRGIPSDRYIESLCRHLNAYRMGDRSEDHLAAIVFNTMGVMRNEAYAEYNNEGHKIHDWGLW